MIIRLRKKTFYKSSDVLFFKNQLRRSRMKLVQRKKLLYPMKLHRTTVSLCLYSLRYLCVVLGTYIHVFVVFTFFLRCFTLVHIYRKHERWADAGIFHSFAARLDCSSDWGGHRTRSPWFRVLPQNQRPPLQPVLAPHERKIDCMNNDNTLQEDKLTINYIFVCIQTQK